MDRTTKLLLALVALGLFANAARGLVSPAWAADTMDCKISGPLDVRVTGVSGTLDVRVTGFDDDIEVGWDFGAAGSSSSSPLYVRSAD